MPVSRPTVPVRHGASFCGAAGKRSDVVKWFKPGKDDFHIYYRGDVPYEPDFVVETKTAKLICETKATKDIGSAEVQEKAKAAVKWCEHASEHEKQVGGKPWSYLLIPHDAVTEAKTIQGMTATYKQATRRKGLVLTAENGTLFENVTRA